MQFKILRSELLHSLSKVTRAVSNKSPLPALSGIKFDVLSDQLILTGSDSDISIQTTINQNNTSLEIIKEGSIVLSSKFILEIIKKIDSKYVLFELIDGSLTKIKSEHSEFQLNGISSSDYPNIDFNTIGEHFTLNSLLLKNTIEQTIFATSDKENRPILTGINFIAANQQVECIATDSYRLAKKIIDVNNSLSFNITIPNKSLNEISKIIEKDEEIDIYITDRKILFIFDNVCIQTRLIDGTFPDTSRLIPTEFDYELKIETREFLSSIDRASLLSNENANIVKLTMTQDKILLTCSSQEIGSVEEHLNNATYIGEPLTISFSSKYLVDAIRSIGSPSMSILFTGEMKPFVVRNYDDLSNIQLVLPVRTY